MSGTGEKRELKNIMQNLHEMLRYLGQYIEDGSKLVLKMDQFEHLRRDFVQAAEQYEQANIKLPNTADRRERGILLYKISSNRDFMDNRLKAMMNICMKMNEKIKSGQHKKKNKQAESGKIQADLQYKNLTVYQLQNTYFKLTKSHPPSTEKPDNYPDQVTLAQLKLHKPLTRGFSQTSDHQSIQYLKEQEILEAIKMVDARIQEKMDYILDGLRMLNYNAVTISQSLGVVHKKIVINVDRIDQNLQHMQAAEKLLEEAAPLVSKPNCIMNVILVILLGILAYFIITKFILNDSSSIIR